MQVNSLHCLNANTSREVPSEERRKEAVAFGFSLTPVWFDGLSLTDLDAGGVSFPRWMSGLYLVPQSIEMVELGKK